MSRSIYRLQLQPSSAAMAFCLIIMVSAGMPDIHSAGNAGPVSAINLDLRGAPERGTHAEHGYQAARSRRSRSHDLRGNAGHPLRGNAWPVPAINLDLRRAPERGTRQNE
jgi:hypothetical protein